MANKKFSPGFMAGQDDDPLKKRQRALEIYPLVHRFKWRVDVWAAKSGNSVSDIDRWRLDPEFVAACKNAATAASIDGTIERAVLIDTEAQLIDKVRAAMPGMTWDEAVEALKIVSRLREAKDRFLLAQKDPYADLPLVTINFNMGGPITTTIEPAPKAQTFTDVVARPVVEADEPAELFNASTQQSPTDTLAAFDALAKAVSLSREGDVS